MDTQSPSTFTSSPTDSSVSKRKPWSEFWLDLADTYAGQATCPRASVGCILVKGNRLISAGFNGSKPGDVHCIDVGCDMVDCIHMKCWVCGNVDGPAHDVTHRITIPVHPGGHCQRTLHAEVNALINCTSNPYGATAFVTHQPCPDCTAELNRMGVTSIQFRKVYP